MSHASLASSGADRAEAGIFRSAASKDARGLGARLIDQGANRRKKQRCVSAQHEPRARGAWYEDPFETAAERWWDGHKWTQEVRGMPVSEQDSTDTLDGSAEPVGPGQNFDENSGSRADGSRVFGLRTNWLLRTIAAAIVIATVRRVAPQLH